MVLEAFSVSSSALGYLGAESWHVLMTDLLLTNTCSHFIAIWPIKEFTGAFRALLKITVDLSH